MVKFYDTRQAGVEVLAADGGVVVKTVLPGKPFADAGVCQGDRLLALDGTRIKDPEQFRRLVRHGAVMHNTTVLSVEHSDKQTATVNVKLSD